nr:hypothetical protein [Tanacetum cinerariifolium]
PEILIVDEALSVGDSYFQHKSFDRIREFQRQGTTLLIVSHDRGAIQTLCSRAILLENGSVLKDGAPEEVMDYYNAIIAEKENSTVQVRELADGSKQTRSGSGEASIASVQLCAENGQLVEFVSVGDRVSLKIKVAINDAVPELPMTSDFYRDFEDRYRGSRELIKHRQLVYLPFILPLKDIYETCNALDLGCGRGEWLEILVEHGFSPLGVDLDDGMLEACSTLGLPTQNIDALTALRSLESESQVVVSGFHIAEHIPFPVLQELVSEALRVLKPGGLLILETPNAENLVVGTNNFYLDPTHERPIPHLLLGFLTEHCGFARTKLLRLQESPLLIDAADVSLFQVLEGASPDYAIVAQKAGEMVMEKFDGAFAAHHGIALNELATRYEDGLNTRLTQLDETTSSLTAGLEKSRVDFELIRLDVDTTRSAFAAARLDADSVKLDVDLIKLDVDAVTDDLSRELKHLAGLLVEAKQAITAVSFNNDQAVAYATALERRVSELEIRADLAEAALRGLQEKRTLSFKAIIRRAVRPLVTNTVGAVLANASVRKHANSVIRKFPAVHQQLKLFARNRGLIPGGPVTAASSQRPPLHETAYAHINPQVMPTQPVVPEGSFLESSADSASFTCVRFTGHIEGHY